MVPAAPAVLAGSRALHIHVRYLLSLYEYASARLVAKFAQRSIERSDDRSSKFIVIVDNKASERRNPRSNQMGRQLCAVCVCVLRALNPQVDDIAGLEYICDKFCVNIERAK